MDICRYYRIRNAVIVYGILGIVFVLVIGNVIFWTLEFVSFFCGDDSWPSGLFLSGLILYCLSMCWRYSSQQAADRRRQRDEEESRIVYYS